MWAVERQDRANTKVFFVGTPLRDLLMHISLKRLGPCKVSWLFRIPRTGPKNVSAEASRKELHEQKDGHAN